MGCSVFISYLETKVSAWRFFLKVLYDNGGGPFTTKQVEDFMGYNEMSQSTPFVPLGLGLVEDVNPGRHGRSMKVRWKITQLGRDLIEGRVRVGYYKARGTFYSLFVQHTWASPLPRCNQSGMGEPAVFQPPVFRAHVVIDPHPFTGLPAHQLKAQPEEDQTAILFAKAHAEPSTVVPTIIPPADSEEPGQLEEPSAGEHPCLLAQMRLNQPSQSTGANHPWRTRVQLPRPT